jgi:UDP-N-acetylglucosamine 2-epimerase (non-hydrolysing)
MICTVVGARPNFIKMAPIIAEINRRGLGQVFVHTGQHYDERMSKIFFGELGMPEPDVYLGVGSGSHAEQTARVMTAFEGTLLAHKPRLVVVAGDVNSTLACALTAAKLGIPVAHVESGLRSFDRTMPEELNRILTDHLAELLFTTEPSGAVNLAREGIAGDKIHFVGNTMIDSLVRHLPAARATQAAAEMGQEPGQYGLVTLHRPANVDDPQVFAGILSALEAIGQDTPLLFPVHPRTRQQMAANGVKTTRIQLVEPLGYLQFLGLMADARLVLTDSGGIQEETTALKVPCVTIRENTERPVTIDQGSNRLAGLSRADIISAALDALEAEAPAENPNGWDGQAALRLVDILEVAA